MHGAKVLSRVLLLALAWFPGAPLLERAQSSANERPICDAGGPYGCFTFHPITFDGRGSYDEDGSIISYSWNFGDGGTGSGPVVQHSYGTVGDYAVTLIVVDNGGLASSCGATASAGKGCDCPPNCDASGPYEGVTGTPVAFDGSRSSVVASCFLPILYQWDFGDGATAQGVLPEHTYSTPGTYVISLIITDSDGAASACTTTATIHDPSAVDPATWGRIKHGRHP